jgi:hypothetical protein
MVQHQCCLGFHECCIDQQCEFIKAMKEVEEKINKIISKGIERPHYQGDLQIMV